jgi:uncharacterized protein YqjF (DUF2071 family)
MGIIESKESPDDGAAPGAGDLPRSSPARPWIMRMTWHDLLFMHWPISPDALRQLLPRGLELDTFDGQAWLGIVPFYMTNVRPRFLPDAMAAAFPEINVRTYARYRERTGVWFFSLDAANRLAVWGARRFYHLPYRLAAMKYSVHDGVVDYASRRKEEDHIGISCRYQATTEPRSTQGSLEYFLTERYGLFSSNSQGELFWGQIHHKPWPLQSAEVELEINTMAKPLGLDLRSAPLLHFAKRLDVMAWPLERLR